MVPKQLKIVIYILGFLAFFTNGDNYAAAPLLINIAGDLNISISSAALSVTSYMLFFGLFTIIFGPLGDKFGKIRILRITAFGTALFSIICSFAASLSFLIILRAINGAFAAGILPVTVAFVGENSGNNQKQNVIGKVMGMMFLGGAAATAIGGSLAFIGSWRTVYAVYGCAELFLAIWLLMISRTYAKRNSGAGIGRLYREAFSNTLLLKLIGIIILIGFSVMGTFAFTGKLLQDKTGFNILFIGLMLSLYGIGTLAGGRNAGTIRNKIGNRLPAFAGILGFASLSGLAYTHNIIFISIALMGFGLSFIFLQSTLVTTAQELLPGLRGTVMSLASFSMVTGGSLGTFINGVIISNYYINIIFYIASFTLLLSGFLASLTLYRNKTKIQES